MCVAGPDGQGQGSTVRDEGDAMADEFAKGDHVTWNSHGGRPRARSSGRSPRTPRRPAARSGPARTTRSTRCAARRAAARRCTSPDALHRRTDHGPAPAGPDTRRHVSETGDQFAGTSAAEHQAQPAGRRRTRARDPGDGARRARRPAPRSGATPSRSPRATPTSTPTRRARSSAGRRWAWTPTRSWPARSWPAGWTGRTSRAPAPTWSRRPATTGRPTPSSPSWSGCPRATTFERIGDVVRALGYPTRR